MRLTMRQQAFLAALLDLYHEQDGAIAYARLAERVGVRKPTAYEMLRLLERKGLVTSEYGQAPRGLGAGRAPVLFRPTPEAEQLIARLGGAPGTASEEETAEWDATKQRVLTALQAGEATEYQQLLEDLLKCLPATQSPLAVAGEVLTVLLVTWRQSGTTSGSWGLLRRLLSSPTDPLGLITLAGTALGLAWNERGARLVLNRLTNHLGRFQTAVGALSTEGLEELHCFARDVATLLDDQVDELGESTPYPVPRQAPL
jgi:DNA-binding MarR family transcriptional regulator